MRRTCFFVFALVASCTQSAPAPFTARVVVTGLKQALAGSPFGDTAIASVALQVNCANGHQESAAAASLSLDPIAFTAVSACGEAQLTLTVQATSSGDPITVYIGTANARLVAGEVAVNFAGQLYGEVDFVSSNGATFTCTGGPQAITVPAVGVNVDLPVGDYTFACTGSDASSATMPVSVSAATRTAISLPSSAATTSDPSDATLAALVPEFGKLAPAFNPTVIDYTLLVSSRRIGLTFNAPANNPLATVTINGASAQSPISLSATPGGDTDLIIKVRSEDGSATKLYVVHVTRGLVTNIAMQSQPASAIASQVFSWDTPMYLFTDDLGGQGDTLTVTLSGPAGVSYMFTDLPVSAGEQTTVPIPLGASFNTIEASAPGGETDSYWIKAEVVAEQPFMPPHSFVGVIANNSGGEVTVQEVVNGNINGVATSNHVLTNAALTDLLSPVALTASADGATIYLAGTSQTTSNGSIAWLEVSGPGSGFAITGATGGHFTTSLPLTPTLLAADAKDRYLFVVSGASIQTLIIVPSISNSEGCSSNADCPNSNYVCDTAITHSCLGSGGVTLPAGGFQFASATAITALAIDPLGRFLFAALSGAANQIVPLYITPSGLLTPGLPLATNNPVTALSVSTQGDVLVFADGTTLFSKAIDPLTGAITALGQVSGIDASGGLAVFEATSGAPFVSLIDGSTNGTLFDYLDTAFDTENGPGSAALGLAVDSFGQYVYSATQSTLLPIAFPTTAGQPFVPGTGVTTLSNATQIFYFDDWQGTGGG